jgi:transcriptional regulator NrdR family protein
VVSRHGTDRGPIRRRRLCHVCGCRFSTVETVTPAGRGKIAGVHSEIDAVRTQLTDSMRRLEIIRGLAPQP